MRRRVIITAIVLIGLIALAIIFFFGNNASNYQKGSPVADRVEYPFLDNKNILFFTGSFFARYSPSNNAVTRLTPTYVFPDILEARWSSKGVLFETSSHRPVDSFSKVLLKKQLDLDNSYWWIADSATGSITLVENREFKTAPVKVVWRNDSKGYYSIQSKPSAEDDIDVIYYHPLSSPAPVKLVEHTGSYIHNPVWSNIQSLIYEARRVDNKGFDLVRLDLKTKKETKLVTNIATGTQVSTDGEKLTYYKNSPLKKGEEATEIPRNDLFLFKVAQRSSHLILRNFGGTSNWSNEHDSFQVAGISQDKLVLATVNASNAKTTLHNAKNNQEEIETSAAFLASIKPFTSWATDLDGKLYFISNDGDTGYKYIYSEPDIIGSESLQKYGLTKYQLQAFGYALTKYLYSIQKANQEINLDSKSVKLLPRNPGDAETKNSLIFTLKTADNSSYTARLELIGLSSTRLYLYTKGITDPIYDSGATDLTLLEVK